MSEPVKKTKLKSSVILLLRVLVFLVIFAGISLFKVGIMAITNSEAKKIDTIAQEISTTIPGISKEDAYIYAEKRIEDGALGLTAIFFVIPLTILGIYLAAIKNRTMLGWGFFSAILPYLAIPILVAFLPKLVKELPKPKEETAG